MEDTMYDPANQKRAVELIAMENRKCSCGRTLRVVGVKALSDKLCEVSCNCGQGGHNIYNYMVNINEI
jgi:hypothetical protein